MPACEGYIYGPGGAQGSPTIQSFTPTRAQRTVDAHARFQNAVNQGNVYSSSNVAAVVFGAALTATGVSHHLTLPLGATVAAVIWRVNIALVTTTTAGGIGLAFTGLGGVQTAVIHGTPGIINPMKLGIPGVAGPGKGQVLFDSACTLPLAPTFLRTCGFAQVTVLAVSGVINDQVDGEIIMMPGTTLSVVGLVGVGTMIASVVWEEVPLANL